MQDFHRKKSFGMLCEYKYGYVLDKKLRAFFLEFRGETVRLNKYMEMKL